MLGILSQIVQGTWEVTRCQWEILSHMFPLHSCTVMQCYTRVIECNVIKCFCEASLIPRFCIGSAGLALPCGVGRRCTKGGEAV